MTTTARPHTDIRTLPPNGYVEGVYAVMNPQLGTTRAGKPYLKCLLRDATGEVTARQWTIDEDSFPQLGSTGFVWAAGHTQVYNGQLQLIVEQIKPVQVGQDQGDSNGLRTLDVNAGPLDVPLFEPHHRAHE